MEGKITASQFRALFQELTGDQSSTNKVCKSVQGFIRERAIAKQS